MKRRSEFEIIAVIMMLLALVLGYFVITTEHIFADEDETVEVTNEEDRETDDKDKSDLEKVGEKIDKVDSKINDLSQDIKTTDEVKEQVKEQQKEIEEIKTAVKAVQETIDDSYTEVQKLNLPGFTIIKSKPLYIYKVMSTEEEGTWSNIWYVASNSDHLGLAYVTTSDGLRGLMWTGLYEENGKTQYVVGIPQRAGRTEYRTIDEAIEIAREGEYGYPEYNITIGGRLQYLPGTIINASSSYQNETGDKVRLPDELYITGGGSYSAIIGQDTDLNDSGYLMFAYTTYISADDRYDVSNWPGGTQNYSIEMVQTIEPYHQEWTTEQLYTPILVIMAVLIIMLFAKKH